MGALILRRCPVWSIIFIFNIPSNLPKIAEVIEKNVCLKKTTAGLTCDEKTCVKPFKTQYHKIICKCVSSVAKTDKREISIHLYNY
jgi:hypothetical protein